MGKSARFILPVLLMIFYVFGNALHVYAQDGDGQKDKKDNGNSITGSFSSVDEIRDKAGVKNFGNAQAFIVEVLKVALSALGIIALLVLVYGGFMYITAAGDEEKAQKAKRLILYVVIGMLLIGISAIVVNVIINNITSGGGE